MSNSSIVAAKRLFKVSLFVRSPEKAITLNPFFLSNSVSSLRTTSLLSAKTTFAPAEHNNFAIDKPTPLLAPVTIAVFPDKS